MRAECERPSRDRARTLREWRVGRVDVIGPRTRNHDAKVFRKCCRSSVQCRPRTFLPSYRSVTGRAPQKPSRLETSMMGPSRVAASSPLISASLASRFFHSTQRVTSTRRAFQIGSLPSPTEPTYGPPMTIRRFLVRGAAYALEPRAACDGVADGSTVPVVGSSILRMLGGGR